MGVAQTKVVMNVHQFHLVLVAAAAIAFCGCSPEPHTARYTVDDYVAKPQVRWTRSLRSARRSHVHLRQIQLVDERAELLQMQRIFRDLRRTNFELATFREAGAAGR